MKLALKIYGLRRSGTNYLSLLLTRNFPGIEVLQYKPDDKHGLPDVGAVQEWEARRKARLVPIWIHKPWRAWLESFHRWCKRDPRDFDPIFVGQAIERYVMHARACEAFVRLREGIEVHYDELVNDEQAAVEAIAAHLGVEAVPFQPVPELVAAAPAEGKHRTAGLFNKTIWDRSNKLSPKTMDFARDRIATSLRRLDGDA